MTMELDEETYALLEGRLGVFSPHADFKLDYWEQPLTTAGVRDEVDRRKVLGPREKVAGPAKRTRTPEQMREWMRNYRATAAGKRASNEANSRWAKSEKGKKSKSAAQKRYYVKKKAL